MEKVHRLTLDLKVAICCMISDGPTMSSLLMAASEAVITRPVSCQPKLGMIDQAHQQDLNVPLTPHSQ